jgi:hypothetical protein
MALFHRVIRTRTQQKSQALRMLLTSGVIRSATVDPPCMAPHSPSDLSDEVTWNHPLNTDARHAGGGV